MAELGAGRKRRKVTLGKEGEQESWRGLGSGQIWSSEPCINTKLPPHFELLGINSILGFGQCVTTNHESKIPDRVSALQHTFTHLLIQDAVPTRSSKREKGD